MVSINSIHCRVYLETLKSRCVESCSKERCVKTFLTINKFYLFRNHHHYNHHHHHHQVYGGCEAVLPKRPEKAQSRCCLLSLQVRTTNFHKGCHTNSGNCKWTSILYSIFRLFQEKRKRRTMLQSSKHTPSSLCSG